MEANVFIFAFPTMGSIVEKITSALDEAFDCPQSMKCEKKEEACRPRCCESQERDFTPPRFKNHSFMPPAPHPQWGVTGKKADENLRFGAEFAIDEPRSYDYEDREEFEYDHQLFDEFVEAGEDCVARGLARPQGVTAHRCNAIRQPIGCPPPMGIDLIGETDWWSGIE